MYGLPQSGLQHNEQKSRSQKTLVCQNVGHLQLSFCHQQNVESIWEQCGLKVHCHYKPTLAGTSTPWMDLVRMSNLYCMRVNVETGMLFCRIYFTVQNKYANKGLPKSICSLYTYLTSHMGMLTYQMQGLHKKYHFASYTCGSPLWQNLLISPRN